MLGFGWDHLVVIFVVAVVVFGPEELPKAMRSAGAMMMKTFNRIAGDFRKQFDDAMRQAEKELDLEETRSMVQNAVENVPRSADEVIAGKDSGPNPAAEQSAESAEFELTSAASKQAS